MHGEQRSGQAVTVSRHTALHVNKSHKYIKIFTDIPITSVRINWSFPCTLFLGILQMPFCTNLSPISPISVVVRSTTSTQYTFSYPSAGFAHLLPLKFPPIKQTLTF